MTFPKLSVDGLTFSAAVGVLAVAEADDGSFALVTPEQPVRIDADDKSMRNKKTNKVRETLPCFGPLERHCFRLVPFIRPDWGQDAGGTTGEGTGSRTVLPLWTDEQAPQRSEDRRQMACDRNTFRVAVVAGLFLLGIYSAGAPVRN